MELITEIKEWIAFGADVLIWFITIYTFYKTFICRKLSLLNMSTTSTTHEGTYHEITLLNRRMAPLVITGVRLIVDNKYLYTLYDGKAVVIEGYSSKTIVSEKYGFLEPDIPIMYSENTVVEVMVDGEKRLYLKTNKRARRYSKRKLNKMVKVQKITLRFDDKIIPTNAKYIISIANKEKIDTIFAFESGYLTECILGYNGLPPYMVKDKKSLEQGLHELLDQHKIDFQVEEIKEIFKGD